MPPPAIDTISTNLNFNHFLDRNINMMREKFKAFLTHLMISAVVAALAIVLVFFVWYPAPLHTAVGVTQIFLIVLAVDVTIGPLVTFIVFKKGKKTLKFDLAVVAILQIAALGYGLHTVFIGRPAFVVFNVDRFTVSRAHELDPTSAGTAEKNNNQSAKESWLQPNWVGAVGSKDQKRKNEITITSALGGADWPQLPELFVPLADVKKLIHERAKPLADLRKLHDQETDVLAELSAWKDTDVKWLPLRSNAKDMVVLVDAKTDEVVETLDIKPWP
jgi:hypothetical protein